MFILKIFRIVSQSQPYFPGDLNTVFHLHYSPSVLDPNTNPPLALLLCLISRPLVHSKAQSWILVQLTIAWLYLHAKDIQIYNSSPDLSATIKA